MQTIQQRIVENLPKYSKNQKTLANFIIENVKMMPLLSVNQVADRTGVSTASVVRFSRLLGFEGFWEMKRQLSEMLKEELSPLERYKKTLSHKEEYEDSLTQVANKAIDNIHLSMQQNDLQEFKHIVNHVRRAENIFCLGMGISHYLAEILAYLLKLYMKKGFALNNASQSFPEQIILMSPKDLLFVFSFPPYSRQTIEAAKQAHELNIPVISFTDKAMAPAIEFSEHALLAKTDNILFTNSLGAISILMNALVTELALAEPDRVLDGLKKVEEFYADERYFY